MRKNLRLFIALALCAAAFYSAVSVFGTRASDESELSVPNDFFEPVELEEDKEVLKGFYSEIQIADAAAKPVTDPPKVNFQNGTISTSDIISLSCDTTNARFYISVSKDAPVDPSEYGTIVFTKFSSRFRLLDDATLYVFARATGMANSEIAVYTYAVGDSSANPPAASTSAPRAPSATKASTQAPIQPTASAASESETTAPSAPLPTTTVQSTPVPITPTSTPPGSGEPPPPSGSEGPPPSGSEGPPPAPQFYEEGESIKVI